MSRVLAVLVVAAVSLGLSGCLRDGFDATIQNLTDTEHEVTVTAHVAGSDEERFREVVAVSAGEQNHALGTLFDDDGTYIVRVSLANGTTAEDTIEWTRKGGPDELTIWLRPEGVSMDVATV